MRLGDWMQTYTGRAFYPLDPQVDDVDLRDIAHALSMICRFGGHSLSYYSVAEHCVLMSRAVAPEHALWALLHDATEAYVGDMVSPLKRDMPEYRMAEHRVMAAIRERFGLEGDCPLEVKVADVRILATERDAMMGPAPKPWGSLEDVEPLDVNIEGWPAALAEAFFLERFAQLVPACTGLTARWCPRHGDCACPDDGYAEPHIKPPLADARCALHAPGSQHAEGEAS